MCSSLAVAYPSLFLSSLCLSSGFQLAVRSGKDAGKPTIDITSHLALFSANELMETVCGDEILSVSHFERHLRYVKGVGGNVRLHLQQFVSSVSESELRALLRFISGTENFSGRRQLPGEDEEDGEHGKGNAVWVLQHPAGSGRMPEARTCFRELYLPHEKDYAVFRGKLETAVREGNAGGFTME